MLRKFLMIGLGGSGGKTLRYLKQFLEERFEEVGWEEGMPDGWQFLHIDTPTTQDSPVLRGSPAMLDPDEYLPLTSSGIGLESIVRSLEGRGEGFAGWSLPPELMRIPIDMGAGQYRAVGRTIGLYYSARIKKRISTKQATLMSAGAAAQLDRLAARLYGDGPAGDPPAPVAIVISSLAGGTGAGVLIDVCDTLRADGSSWLDKSIGVIYSADVFADLSAAAGAGIQPNTAATIAELLHGYFGDGDFVPPGGGALQQRSGPAFPYLVGHANTKGVSFGDQVAVYRVMARCLGAVMTDPRIQDDFTVYKMANWDVSAGEFPDRSGATTWMLPAPRYQGALQALGFAEVDLGVARLRTYAEQRITRDAVEWLLDGHMAAAQKTKAYENATPGEVVEGLADRSFTRFLNLCGLNERGREQNQILDAIKVPDAELRAECMRIAKDIDEAGRDHFGTKTKARVGDWADFIVDELQSRSASALKTLGDQLRDACLRWVDEIPDRLLQVVGDTLAEQGAPVLLKILAMTDAELDHVRAELEDERHEELYLAEPVRSDVSDAMGVSSGKVAADSELVKRALQAAVQTGIVRRYNGEHRRLAARLADDLRHGVIEPLTRALRDASDELRLAAEPDESQTGVSPIKDWPRHDPPADRLVPDSLKPGNSVKLVIDPANFPDLFDDLTTRSSGYAGKQDAWRQVRRIVISGDADRPRMGRWIAVDAKWTAPEWLTVDAAPSRASFTARISRDELLDRARSWLNTDSAAWEVFLSQGLRGYLSDGLPPAERIPREKRFLDALEAAFEAAEPLVSVDQEMLDQVHPGSDLRIRPYTNAIPVSGLPIEDRVQDFLIGRFKDVQDNYQEVVTQLIDRSEHETRVAVYSTLGGALHPMVFESLNKPIAEAWGRAHDNSFLTRFWKARRSRVLSMAVPVPRPALQAMVRGWFIGQLLGLIAIRGDRVAFETGDGGFTFETMLPVPGQHPVLYLATLMESMALAVPVGVRRRQPDKYLRPYTQLIEWGSEPRSSDLESFRQPSRVLMRWLENGTAPGSGSPRVSGDSRTSRRSKAITVLTRQIDLYKGKARRDLTSDRTADNAWLGLADLIDRGLGEIVTCLERDADETGDEWL